MEVEKTSGSMSRMSDTFDVRTWSRERDRNGPQVRRSTIGLRRSHFAQALLPKLMSGEMRVLADKRS